MGFTENFNQHLGSILEALGSDYAIFTPQGGDPSTIYGIFENGYFEYPEGSVGIASSQPRFTCQTVDVPGVKFGDTITLVGLDYKIISVHPDGTGLTLLILEKQP